MKPLWLFLIMPFTHPVIFALLYWLVVETEGSYLGRRFVIWLYDLFAVRYENVKGYDPIIESRYLARPILQRISPNNAPMVLDAAAGTCRVARALCREADFHGAIIATDMSRAMLHVGVRRVIEWMAEGRVHLMQVPAETLPFPDDSFDLVTCLEALEFMQNPRRVIAELIRVTRPGGQLVLTNRKGHEARMMPGKAWSREQAHSIYTQEFGLQAVEIKVWQLDYDLVWAQKPGTSPATRARSLEEVWQCPRCQQLRLEPLDDQHYECRNCQQRVEVGEDGVIEMMKVKTRR